MTPDQLQEIDARLLAFEGQLIDASGRAEYGTLDRAADLAARFEDRSWVQDLPPLPESPRRRGHQPDPASRARFNQWLRDVRGWKVVASTSGRLLKVHGFVNSVATGNANRFTGEGAVRPLYRLERKGFEEQIATVVAAAQALAGQGRPVTSEHTRQAVRDFFAALPKEQIIRNTSIADAKRKEARLLGEIEELFQLGYYGELAHAHRRIAELLRPVVGKRNADVA